MKILVSGRDGQVGSALQKAASQQEITVVALGRSELDITDPDKIALAFKAHEPDVVVNAAAYTAVDKAETDESMAMSVNRDGPLFLAEACSSHDIPFLHISTDFVFDGRKDSPYLEDDACAPLSTYGQSKRAGELAVQENCKKHIILRTSWVFGGEVNFVSTMRRLAESRDELSVVDDQRGGPTPAIDIAHGLITISKTVMEPEFNDWGIYHFSGSPAVSWYEFACEILKDEETTKISPIPSSEYPTPATRPANSVLDCSKIQRIFGLPQPNWRAALV